MRISPRRRTVHTLLMAVAASAGLSASRGDDAREELPLHLSWGHRSSAGTAFAIELIGENVSVADSRGHGLEQGEGLEGATWKTSAAAVMSMDSIFA